MSASTLACKICSSDALKRCDCQPGYQQPETFSIYHCPTCEVAFAHPLKVDSRIYNHIYARIEDVAGYSRYLTYANQVPKERDPLAYLASCEDVYWGIREVLRDLSVASPRVLEVGSGFGYLTYALSSAGYDVEGLDISAVAVEQSTKRFGDLFVCDDIHHYSQNHPAQFDVVIFTEVIEHIEDIRSFLQDASNLLTSQGVIILTTPNRSIYKLDVLWHTEPPPVHLWWFSEGSIEKLAGQLGLSASFVDFQEFNKRQAPAPVWGVPGRFAPTCRARFRADGEVLKESIFLYNTLNASALRGTIKQVLHSVGVWVYLQKFKRFIINGINKAKGRINTVESRRPTMCAVLRKTTQGSVRSL